MSSLAHVDQAGTVQDLYKHFLLNRLGSQANLNNRMIEIHFVYNRETVVRFLLLLLDNARS